MGPVTKASQALWGPGCCSSTEWAIKLKCPKERSLEGNQVAGLHHASWTAFPGGRRPGRMKYVPMCPSSGLGSSEFIDASWMPVLGVYQEESPSLCHLLRTTSPEVVSGRCHKETKVLPDSQTQCGGLLVLTAPPLTLPPSPAHPAPSLQRLVQCSEHQAAIRLHAPVPSPARRTQNGAIH